MKPKLSLKTERLAELSPDDLHRVAGAAQDVTVGTLCGSLIGYCYTYRNCSTVNTCGCEPSWDCS